MQAIHFSKKNIFRNTSLAIFTAVTLASCSTMATSKSKVGTSQANISNTQWTLADNVKGNKPTLVIEGSKITGNGGCNNYFAELMLDPTVGNFSTKNIGATKKACPNMSEESNYFSTLSAATKYVVNGNTLELYKDNLLLLKFTKL
ncbi:META domain-containing protein [Kaistella carnis]|uniref:META domain-containing protein n=1 Tax=Kaistella carnis TaxID=1241979 RepID=UPI0028B1C7C7|nr:META domain-containing protein [Kaistella carnis]